MPPDFWTLEPPEDAGPASPSPARPRPSAALENSSPLFAELQSLFPGRLVRVEPLKAKEAEGEAESEAVDETVDEAVQHALFGDEPADA